MNGIGLLVLIAAVGQVAAAPPAQNRDWGWEVDKEGALCYIVQLSPQKVAEMQDTGWEYPSDMPEELVGRVTRISIRIGTAVLPRTPSLEEIKKLPRLYSPADVTAQLGPGRISEVESLYNVQQDRNLPALPSFGSSSPAIGIDPAGNLIDQVQQNNNALADKAKNFVRGTPEIPGVKADTATANPATPGVAAGDPPALPSFPGASGTNKFDAGGVAGSPGSDRYPSNSGNQPYGGAASGNWQPPTNSDPRSRDDMTRITDNRAPHPNAQTPAASNPGYGNNPGMPANAGYGSGAYNAGAGYDPRDPASLSRDMFNGVQNRQTPAGGFGSYNGGNNLGNYTGTFGNQNNGGIAPGPGYGREEYASRQNQNHYNPNSNPMYADTGTRLAANPPAGTGLPGTNAPAVNPPSTPPSTAANVPAEPAKPTKESSASQNILPVFFLLSLVVNLYLGFLISKLLKRYRALLANMRGQTATNAYS